MDQELKTPIKKAAENYLSATLTAQAAAAYIGVSYWLVLELVKKGKIPAIRVGSRVLFRRETIDRWMEDQEAVSVNQNPLLQVRRIK